MVSTLWNTDCKPQSSCLARFQIKLIPLNDITILRAFKCLACLMDYASDGAFFYWPQTMISVSFRQNIKGNLISYCHIFCVTFAVI